MSILYQKQKLHGQMFRGGYEGGGTDMGGGYDGGGNGGNPADAYSGGNYGANPGATGSSPADIANAGGSTGYQGDGGGSGMSVEEADQALLNFDIARETDKYGGILSGLSKMLGLSGMVLNQMFGPQVAAYLGKQSATSGTMFGGAANMHGADGGDPLMGYLLGENGMLTNYMNGGAGSGNIADMLTSSANLTQQIAQKSWDDWINTDKAALQGMAATGDARGTQLYDTSQQVANEQLGLARKSNDDYEQYMRPFVQQQADYVNKLGSPEYIAQQRAQAMESAQGQADTAWQQQQRRALGMGANVNSGAFAAGQADWAREAAKLKVAAAMKSDSDTFGKWAQGLTDTNNYGLALQKQGLAANDSALNWNKFGADASKIGFGMGLDVGKLGTAQAAASGNTASAATSGANTANRNANDYALGLKTSDRADDAANPWTTLGGTFLGSVAKPVAGKVGDFISSLF